LTNRNYNNIDYSGEEALDRLCVIVCLCTDTKLYRLMIGAFGEPEH